MKQDNFEFIEIDEAKKDEYNGVVGHPIQSFEWGEFRKKTGVKVIRRGLLKNGKIIDGFTLTIHKIPSFPYFIGYLAKGNLPKKETIKELIEIGKKEKCVYIQLEPNVRHEEFQIFNKELISFKGNISKSFHPLFTKFTFCLSLKKSEEDLFKSFHSKTRYNIKVAQRYNVEVKEDNSEKAFEKYLELTEETTKRQNFYAHTKHYHELMWQTLSKKNKDGLTAYLLLASYEKQTLAAWILFSFKNKLYYPYGASSTSFRNVMASNLIMWEAIKFGKKLGLSEFDMWGSLGENPDKSDPWFGFHRFKQGYNPELVEFIGSYDLIINKNLYKFVKIADKIRWKILKIKKRFL